MTKKVINLLQIICPTGYYGAERWVLALAKNIDSSKVNCELVIPLEEGDDEHQLIKEFKEINLPTSSLSMKHKFDFGIIKRLANLIKERNIDVIHTHGYKSDIIGVLAAKKANIPVVITPHGFENTTDIKLRSYIWLGCQAMRFATKVAPLSTQLCKDVQKFGVTKSQLSYIQNGVDLSEVEAQLKHPKQNNDKTLIIGFIGQLISRKNVTHILDTFDNIFQNIPNVKLQLLGNGDCKDDLEKYAQQLPSSACIEFLGFQPNRLDYLQNFDLFVMTSSLEGIPRCLMEAMAMGIPVSAYNIPGIDQLITHNKTGLLANYDDKKALLADWTTLLTNKPLAAQLANDAQQFIHQEYSAKRMANQYLELFSKMLKE